MPEFADELYAWVTDVNGKPSLIGTLIGQFHMPLIFASAGPAMAAEPFAVKHGQDHGQPVRLVKFKAAGVLKAHPPCN